MKKALYKDIFKEIINTKGRFLSIVIMMALGVFVYTGLNAIGPSMKKTANEFSKVSNMSDLTISSFFGLNSKDIKIINSNKNIKDIEYTHFVDLNIKGTNTLVRIETLPKKISKAILTEGRYPENGEIILDQYLNTNKNYKIGDYIVFKKENSFNKKDFLKIYKFKIVGFCITPEYISTSSKGISFDLTGELNGFGFIKDSNFYSKDFKKARIIFNGVDEKDRYENNNIYKKYIEKQEDFYKTKFEMYSVSRINNIKREIDNDIDKTKKDLDLKKNELFKAKEKLDNAEKKLNDVKNEIENNRIDLENIFLEKEAKLKESKLLLIQKQEDINLKNEELLKYKLILDENEDILKKLNKEFEENKIEILNAKIQIKESLKKLELTRYDLNQKEKNLKEKKMELLSKKSEIIESKKLIDDKLKFYNMNTKILLKKYDFLKKMHLLNPQIEEIYKKIVLLDDNYKKINDGISQIDKNIIKLNDGYTEIDRKKSEIIEKKQEIDLKQKSFDESYVKFTQEKQEFLNKKNEITKNLDNLKVAFLEIEKAKKELNENENKLKEFKDLTDLNFVNAKINYESANKEFKENLKNYEKNKKLFDEKELDINDALTNAKRFRDNIKNNVYSIISRDENLTYYLYYDASDRLNLLAIVFPTFFFLIASLVTLTTMTRMVDERRLQIGTYKALGYSNIDIYKKFFIYGLSSSFIGWFFGIILGKKILVKIIFNAYATNFVLKKVVNYTSYKDFAFALFIAIFCSAIVSVNVVKDTLKENTANLLKVKSPSFGSKILIENITFIWSRLKFLQKVTARNMFRYKKRMYMTILGVAGCTGILFMGFALKDSVSLIPNYQFNFITKYDFFAIYNNNEKEKEIEKLKKYVQNNSKIKYLANVYIDKENIKPKKELEQTYTLVVPDNLEDFSKMVGIYKDNDFQLKNEIDYIKNGIMITSKLASVMNVKKGDFLEIKNSNNVKKIVKIGEVIEGYIQHYIYMDKEYYKEIYGNYPKNNAYMVKTFEKKDINQIKTKLMKYSAILSVVLNNTNIIDSLLEALDMVVVVIITVSSLLAFIVLFNLTNINISERIRELSTIKVLGFYDTEVTAYVYRETLILCLFGIILGYGFGIVLHKIIINFIVPSIVRLYPIALWQTYVKSAILTYIFSFVVMIFIHIKLLKIDMVQSLKSYE